MKWFKRKPKNRRVGREHVLDVKMRSQHTRAVRVRLAATVFTGLLGTGLAFFGLWRGSEWALDEWIYKNPAFNIQRVEIQTDGVIPFTQIRTWAGIKEGENLWATDLSRIRRDLESQSLVQSASVERVLPNMLRLRVAEREPIAQINGFISPGTNVIRAVTYYLDETGVVMVPLTVTGNASGELPPPDSLPLITGILGTELRPGRRVESLQIHAALRLIAAFANSQMSGLVDLKSIDVSSPQTLHVMTVQGNEIVFPLEGLERQLRRWCSVQVYATQARKAIAMLDLSVSNNVPARWQEASVAVPIRPKLQKQPSRYRKKHV